MKLILMLFVTIFVSFSIFSQIDKFEIQSNESFRGLSLLNDSTVWASGTNGTYLYTEDYGNTWYIDSVELAKKLDFRDIEVINDSTVYLLTAGSPALLLKTTNKGKDWKIILEDNRKEIFMDGLSFWNDSKGMMFGDPINEKFTGILIDNDSIIEIDAMPLPITDEAGFAASGTGIATLEDGLVWIATGGGEVARVFCSSNYGKEWSISNTPIISGEGKGIFSIVFWNDQEGLVVGGSYTDSTNATKNCAITEDGGKTWKLIFENQPGGYRSCVASTKDGELLIAVGRTGIDFSKDKGKTWHFFSDQGYYSVVIGDKYAWFSGRNGKIDKLNISSF